MDTIDVSNLNRQFLFQAEHVKQSKAMHFSLEQLYNLFMVQVARESVLPMQPDVEVEAYVANIITDPRFDFFWFNEFDLVLNALDNYEARHHVNAMCLATNTPLIESGTEGFNGQVQVHVKVRAPLHELFGNPEDVGDTIDEHEGSENANEMEHLRREKESLKRIREAAGTEDYGRLVFEKVFSEDIKALLQMEELWKKRTAPKLLDYHEATHNISTATTPINEVEWERKVWNLAENTRVFLESVNTLAGKVIEMRASEGSTFGFEFDKDNEADLNFVTAAANLRAEVYGLDQKSRFDVKEMAGNIIPAVATTNAVVAGVVVVTAVTGLESGWDACRNAWVTRIISPEVPKPKVPNDCPVCSITSIDVTVNVEETTLGEFVAFLKAFPTSESDGLELQGALTVMEGGRQLYDDEDDDEDDEDEEETDSTLAALSIKSGCTVQVISETKNLNLRIWGGGGGPRRLPGNKQARRLLRPKQQLLP
ncbi:E1 ubiquitin-activating protein uba2 [Geranomyces variabilis]|uniref:E1 ubiquitin-activating protein uba2 n=1 Tax=Geranomyces variabilis TaxID=109894 RepID=A0AAD5XST6_9FUNG|nr:E1 ubiquitin-activating protein uba2 [Geranomyces variabilis]